MMKDNDDNDNNDCKDNDNEYNFMQDNLSVQDALFHKRPVHS